MPQFDLDSVPWADVTNDPVPRDVVRTLAYTQDVGFMAQYLFAGDEGRQAARKVDDTIRKLPGFTGVRLLEAWMDRHLGPNGRHGGHDGHGHH